MSRSEDVFSRRVRTARPRCTRTFYRAPLAFGEVEVVPQFERRVLPYLRERSQEKCLSWRRSSSRSAGKVAILRNSAHDVPVSAWPGGRSGHGYGGSALSSAVSARGDCADAYVVHRAFHSCQLNGDSMGAPP